ncbi:MAG: zeta toxin [Anaerolineaceae bacterium]|nr:MAG: zeta toxin [Anaerolineaceae bacterium]
MSNPSLFVIAGPNGAGKSTGAATILPKRFPTDRFLNADDIANALATDSPIEAGRVMIRRMHELRERRETFAFETTLAGKTHARFLTEAQDAGYKVHLAYLWLSSVELARKRVSVRVQRGGHDIPPADVERRYWRGLGNFFRLYLLLANRWALCDNSGSSLVLVARGRQGEAPAVYDRARFDGIQNAAKQD